MVLVRYNPWQDMSSFQRQLNRLFDDALTTTNRDGFNNLAKMPAAEITETDDALYLKLEVPGMEAKDIDIQVMVDRVAIVGERKSETRSEGNGRTREDAMFEVASNISAVRSEFRYGKFQRVIPLAARIQNTNVTAEYKNGILSLTLPKAEEEKNKVVKVNLSEAETTA
jgi:HSP20 family protein